jgi:hypothetical protein
MNHKVALTLLSIGLGLLLLVSCSQASPTPTPTVETPPTGTPTVTASVTPPPTATPTPTDTPEPTSTSTPSATPEPLVIIQVVDEESGEPLPGATVRVTSEKLGYDGSQTTNADGQATFAGVEISSRAYEVAVTAEGYYDATTVIKVRQGKNDLTVSLTPGVFAQVTEDTASLHSGPGTVYEIVGEVSKGDVLSVVGQSEDGEWLVVETDEGETGWLAATLVNVEGNLAQVEEMASPPTPTPTPTAIPVAPAPTTAATPPAPAGFDGVALRDNMVHLRWVIDQIGGLLDRVYSGQYGSCPEYEGYYQQVAAITTYPAVPGDWQGVYNEYIWAADNILATNKAVYSLCLSGGGVVTALNYGVARQGIQDSVLHLIPAIETANALLGQ